MAESKSLRVDTEMHAESRRKTESRRAPAPKGPTHALDIRCAYCPGKTFRRSRLRSPDFKELLRFRYPVRCLKCSQRQLVGFTIAALSLSSYVKHQRPTKVSSTWANPVGTRALQGAGKPPVGTVDAVRRDESAS